MSDAEMLAAIRERDAARSLWLVDGIHPGLRTLVEDRHWLLDYIARIQRERREPQP